VNGEKRMTKKKKKKKKKKEKFLQSLVGRNLRQLISNGRGCYFHLLLLLSGRALIYSWPLITQKKFLSFFLGGRGLVLFPLGANASLPSSLTR
jgi:hypothetical protein